MQPLQRFLSQTALNRIQRHPQVGRTSGEIVAVGTEQMDFPGLQHPKSLSSCGQREKRRGACLYQYLHLPKFLPQLGVSLVPQIPLYMGQHHSTI